MVQPIRHVQDQFPFQFLFVTNAPTSGSNSKSLSGHDQAVSASQTIGSVISQILSLDHKFSCKAKKDKPSGPEIDLYFVAVSAMMR